MSISIPTIMVMLSIHARADGNADALPPLANFPFSALRAEIATLLDADLICACSPTQKACPTASEGYRPTSRGRVWVAMLLSTPLPVSSWHDPRLRDPLQTEIAQNPHG